MIKFLVSLGLGSGILYLVFRKFNAAYQESCRMDGIPADQCSLLQKVWTDFSQANFFWIGVVLLAFMISNYSRARRWQMLLHPLGYKATLGNSFWTIVLGYFANLGIPRMGEIVRATALSRYENIPVEKVMGTIVLDRLVDFFSLATVIGLTFLLEFDRLWSFLKPYVAGEPGGGSGASYLVLIFLILAAGGGMLFWRILRNNPQNVFFQKAANVLKGFAEGLQSIRKVQKPLLFVWHSVLIWVMYYLMTYLCFRAFEPTAALSPIAGLMVFVFGSLGIVVPSPGGMGTYHFLVPAALAIYGINGNDGFSFANIMFFSVQLFGNIVFGIMALIALPMLNRKPQSVPAA